MTDIWLMRHGMSCGEARNVYGQHRELWKDGMDQVNALRNSVPFNPDYIFTSTDMAAQHTAHFAFPNSPHIALNVFDDVYFGKLDGQVKNPYVIHQLSCWPSLICNAYRGDNVFSRALLCVKELTRIRKLLKPNQVALVITHEVLLQAICAIIHNPEHFDDTPGSILGSLYEIDSCQGFSLSDLIYEPKFDYEAFNTPNNRTMYMTPVQWGYYGM